MKVEMLRSKLYRENHCETGMVVEVDDHTGAEWVALGWARSYAASAPIQPEVAEALVPTQVKRRRALR